MVFGDPNFSKSLLKLKVLILIKMHSIMSDLYLTHLIRIGNIENSTCGCFIHILTVCQKNVTLVDGFFVQLDITFVNDTQVCNQIK